MQRRNITVLLALALLLSTGCMHLQKMTRPAGQTFDSAGCPVHFSEYGDGPPVVLLHGFAANGTLNWKRTGVVKALRDDFRVIVPDLRGHGLSCKPHETAAYGREMAHDVIRLMDHLDLKSAHVAGYSLGGHITLALAAAHPERLRSAVIIAAGWEREPAGEGPLHASRLIRVLRDPNPFAVLTKYEGAGFETVLVSVLLRLGRDEQAMAAVLDGANELTVPEEGLRRLELPMQIIIGTDDPLYGRAQALYERVPHAQWTAIDGAGHIGTPLAAEMRQALDAFLSGQHSGTASR